MNRALQQLFWWIAALGCVVMLYAVLGCAADPVPFREGAEVIPPPGCEELRKRPEGEC